MAVGAIGPAAAQTPQATAAAKTGMDYQAFLRLLVAEMKHQDPLNPTSSSEYVAQFASFANVEQSIQTNKKLDAMMTVSALTQASSIIGRTATSGDGEQSGIVKAIRVTTDGAVAILADDKELLLGSGTRIE